MAALYDAQAPKRPVNLSLNGDLVERARREGLNLSALAEAAVAGELARRSRLQWDAEIAQACAAHERYLEEFGSASELLRAHLEAEGAADGTGESTPFRRRPASRARYEGAILARAPAS